MDEAACMARWLPLAALDVGEAEQVRALATNAVLALRTQQPIFDVFSHLLQAYPLTTRAGCQLMALAEALLRTSDTATAQALLRDKLAGIDWVGEAGRVPAMDLAAIAQGLASVARVTRLPGPDEKESLGHALTRLVSEPVVLQGLRQGISGLAERFVMADTLEQALERADADLQYGIGHSFDMLGEAVLTSADAGICKDAYRHAIQVLGANRRRYADGLLSLSLKLSALHPRLEATQYARISELLLADVLSLLEQARAQGVAVTLDAEENDRLELHLRVLERMLHSPGLRGWGGLGVAVQAYNRRAPAILGWLGRLSHACGCVIPVRLVKGAYWDSEVKLAQLRGLADYPVLTRKSATDVAYLGCARLLLGPALSARLRPRFATHNAHTSAAVIAMARRGGVSVEFEHLHGMGQDLHAYWRA
ncbi:MAG: proline dehydrogenase family protein, partial [Gammaproteobacteria bacterium]|nr:proline dehydrogenase family protein [Gammaproteobacteria bacterium]